MANKKNICIITTISITIKSFLIDTIEYLKDNEYQVTVICHDDHTLQNFLPDGVKYIPITMNRGINIKECIINILKLIKIFKREDFDLVQYSTPNASLYASISSFIARVPVRLYCQWGIVYVGFNGIKRKLFKMIEKIVCGLSTRIEPDSFGNLIFSHNEGLYSPKKSSVIWNGSAGGVDLSKFDISNKKKWREEIRKKYNICHDDFVYGFVGRINKDKGLNELIASFKKISRKNINAKLIIVGPQDKIEDLDRGLYEWSINNKSVIYCGSKSEVEKYYAAMDTFILPSYREGFGSVVIEAEAMGVPVIVSNIPGPTDAMIDGKTGIVVECKDIDSLYNAMLKVAMHQELAQTLSKEGAIYARENFDKNILMKHILTDRNELLQERRTS